MFKKDQILESSMMTSQGPNYVYLSDELHIADGGYRKVYQHPDYPDRLIKTSKLIANKWINNESISYKSERRYFKYFLGEFREYLRACIDRAPAPPTATIQKIFGIVDTNFGPGLVVKAERNEQKEFAKTLSYIIENGQFNQAVLYQLKACLLELLELDICLYDLTMRNFVYSFDEQHGNHFVLIDGFGDKQTIPLSVYFSWERRHRRRKLIKRLQKKLAALLEKNARKYDDIAPLALADWINILKHQRLLTI